MIDAKVIALDMEIEPVFLKKRQTCRKRHFDEISNNKREQQSSKESFRTDYFLVIVDIGLGELKSRFEQLHIFESIFGFLFDAAKLTSLDENELRSSCLNLENALKNDNDTDIDARDLESELQVLQVMLPSEAIETDKPWTSIKILEFVKSVDMFPNVMVAYRILLTIPVTVASAERSFSKLKLLKSYLRTTMAQDRLNGLAILCIERDMLENIKYYSIIDDFAPKLWPPPICPLSPMIFSPLALKVQTSSPHKFIAPSPKISTPNRTTHQCIQDLNKWGCLEGGG